MTDRPNFVVIITDQHRADWLGCAGHPVVKTPNIDALAAQGTRFEDFHVALPVCMPNRASLMTGRMPSVHGLRHNGCVLPKRANTFVDVLAAAGYATASIGKTHFQPFTVRPPMRAPDTTERLIEEAWAPDPEAYEQEQPTSYQGTEETPVELPYYGFQHADMITEHGDQCGGHYAQWFRKTYPNWSELHNPANELPHDYTCPQAYRTPIPEEGYPTAWVGDRAVSYIEARAEQSDPFLAFVSFPDPHHPFNPPGKYWDMYSPDQFEVDLPYRACGDPTPPMQHISAMFEAGTLPPSPQMPFRVKDQHAREAMALTAGMITMIDDQVGRVVRALKDAGHYDNTVILFTSDHGDYMGDFNMLLKGPLPMPSITRVPMIWSDPNTRAAVTTPELASTIDISASILDRAGLAPYVGMQGRSFLPALDGRGAHRSSVMIEHNDGGPRMGFAEAARVRTLRTKDWRMSVYAGETWGELYNLAADPRETQNLWEDPAHAAVKGRLSLDLIDHLTFQMDESPRANRLA